MSQLFTSGQSTGASASASVLPMNTQGWFSLGLTGLISLQSKGLSRLFSNTTVQKHQFFGAQPSLWSMSHIHTWLLEKLVLTIFCSVQLLHCVWLFATPWTAARQASISITNFWSWLKLMSIKSVMPPNHLILCYPLLLSSVFPSIRVFSNEEVLLLRPNIGASVRASVVLFLFLVWLMRLHQTCMIWACPYVPCGPFFYGVLTTGSANSSPVGRLLATIGWCLVPGLLCCGDLG